MGAEAKPVQGRKTLGRYELRGVLGRGVSTVYDGWDPAIARRVAIKVVRLEDSEDSEVAQTLARFRREAQLAGGLVHPNIIGLYDYHEGEGDAYTVMELVEGRALNEVLRERGRLTLAEAMLVMDDLLAALQFVHARGIVHRDIKPANLMITGDGRVKLADFGIAHTESSQLTQEGLLIGTIAFMAPEQHAGREVDARTDLFAAGVLLQQVLTGRSPFEGAPAAGVRRNLADEPCDLAMPARARLDRVIARAMAQRPEDRFADARSFAAALREAAGVGAGRDEGSGADETVVMRRDARPAGRRRGRGAVVVAGVLAVGLVLGGGYAAFRLMPPPSADPVGIVAAAVWPVACSFVSVQRGASAQGGEAVVVTGTVGDTAEAGLRAIVAAASNAQVDWRLSTFDGPFCAALDMMRPLAARVGGAARGLALSLPGNRSAFVEGERLLLDVSMPDFAAYLTLDYVMHDGSVLHVVPGDQYPQRRLAAGAHLQFGAPDGGFPGWEFQEPFGREMIVAVASATPLPDMRGDSAGAYLARLRAAVSEAVARGEAIAATVRLVDTVAQR